MNYIQTLHFLNDKLSYYKSRLDMMKNSDRTFSQRDWDITINKIDKMEKLFPKVGKKVAQQFNQQEEIMEKICSGNYENVLALIDRAKHYNIWVQVSDEDGVYEYVTREQFENKMVDLIEDNNCHIENFYFQNEDDELTYERRI